MLRDLERTPVLGQEGLVLSKNDERKLRRIAAHVSPRAKAIEGRWRRRLGKILAQAPDNARLRALKMLNPGAWLPLLQTGEVAGFLEAVDYHGKRLAKLDVPPHDVLAAVSTYEHIFLLDLRRNAADEFPEWSRVVEQLYFALKLTLNNAY